ncbi:MAG: protease complex subunit PrcB family protein [Elusimicrobia bacterium]|nr:protease complex subunit PrcB family protein [Elusimicrobiota bacterium]
MLIALLFAGSAAMNVSAAGRKAEKPMEWKGQYGGPIDPGTEVAADESAWTRLWLMVGSDAPPLDFKKYFAVAVFAGERPTGGYTVEFLEPVAKGADVIVRYRIKEPAGFATQAIAQPWKVRAFARVKGKVFVEAAPAEAKKK